MYRVAYQEMRNDYRKTADFTSQRKAVSWARRLVAAAYRNEASATVYRPDGFAVTGYYNVNGRAVRTES